MTTAELVSRGTVVTFVITAFVLGFAPVLVIRLAVLLYPKDHPRRAELIGEAAHVSSIHKVLPTWFWLGQVVCTALFEGGTERSRLVRRRLVRRFARTEHYTHIFELKISHRGPDGTVYLTRETVSGWRGDPEEIFHRYAGSEGFESIESFELNPVSPEPGRHKAPRRRGR